MIDNHIHTELCNHAKGSMVSYIEKAIEKGLGEITFLDHLILYEDVKIPSMSLKEAEFYFLTISKFKNIYKERIKINAGLEIDYAPDFIPVIEKITEQFDFDLIGGACHFVEIDGKLLNIASRRALNEVKEIPDSQIRDLYLKKLSMMIKEDVFDIICHIDLINRFKYSDDNTGFIEILDLIKKYDKVLEVNSGGFSDDRKMQYPSDSILKECFKRNIKVTTGSDAHSPDEVGRDIEKAVNKIKKLGYKNIYTFRKREKLEVPL